MTFFEALYGSQYYEIQKQGKDGNKGRLNGNLFLSVLIILVLIAFFIFLIKFVPGFNDTITKQSRKLFGYSGGKTIGKILTVPLVAIIYLVVSNTIGSKNNFRIKTEAFMLYPDEIKKKANAKLLVPFFILLALIAGLVIC